jgi:tRNA dimethylallyltransferase
VAQVPPLIVIGGPTATGKTRLALELAERLPGAEIISADSRQVYRGMDIGTAKVAAADRTRVPHHGLDLVEPDEEFTAADYLVHARAALAGIAARGGIALLVGGTGLYLRAVARGLPLADTGRDRALRAQLEGRLAGEGLHVLVAELRSRAPSVAAGTDLANPRRVVRALERAALHGDRLPPPPAGYAGPLAFLGLDVPAAINDEWIAHRARGQFETGLIEEAATLRDRYGAAAPAFSAIGYREAFAVLDGSATRDEALVATIRRTRQFARRQRTWFRRERDITWLDPREEPLPAALALARRLRDAQASEAS